MLLFVTPSWVQYQLGASAAQLQLGEHILWPGEVTGQILCMSTLLLDSICGTRDKPNCQTSAIVFRSLGNSLERGLLSAFQ